MQTGACRIKESVGGLEPCPGDRCLFWEDGRCAFQQLDLRGRPELAEFLLHLRSRIESIEEADHGEAAARRVFFQRLNAGRSD